jgi:hypothetical protein
MDDQVPDIGFDLMQPRYAVVTDRGWMEAYHELELASDRVRQAAREDYMSAIIMWMRCLRLYREAFTRTYELPSETLPEVSAAFFLRLEWIGLSGLTSKVALDNLLDGSYTQAYMLIRHMIDSWRRILFIRLSDPDDIWRWYPEHMVPRVVLDRPDYRHRESVPNYRDEMLPLVTERGSERDKRAFDKLGAGFLYLHEHAHPTLEGATQQRWGLSETQRAFGPHYSQEHLRRGLKWGLSATLLLLQELDALARQSDQWFAEARDVNGEFSSWLTRNQEEILPHNGESAPAMNDGS